MYILKDILIELKYLPIALAAGILIGGVLLVFHGTGEGPF